MTDLTILEKDFNEQYQFSYVRQEILKMLSMVNEISDDKYIKVAYIKILDHLIMYTYRFEEALLSQQSSLENLDTPVLENKIQDQEQVKMIKATLKTQFNHEVAIDKSLVLKFNESMKKIDQILISWVTADNQQLFNQYLIKLIHPDTLSDFIWCNTFINNFSQKNSMNNIVNSYQLLPELTVEELYEMYLFISEFNINEILLADKDSELPPSENVHKVFEYLYDIVDNNINFIPKEEQQQRLSFTNVVDSYVSVEVPNKSRFLSLVNKVNEMLSVIENNDNVKVLFTRAYPLFIEAFYQPSDKVKAIRYQLSNNFKNTKQYFALLQQTIH